MANGIGQHQNPSYGALKGQLPQGAGTQLPYGAQYSVKEATQDVKNTAQNSWLGSIIKGFGIEDGDPKKLVICVLGAVGAVFGIGYGMKAFIQKGYMGKFGNKLDDFSNKLGLGDFGKKVSDKLAPAKKWFAETGVGKKLKAIFEKDANGVRKNMLGPKNMMAKPMMRGTGWEVIDNLCDPLEKMVKDGKTDDFIAAFKKAGMEDEANKILNNIAKIKTAGGDIDKKMGLGNEIAESFKKFYGYDSADGIKKNMSKALQADKKLGHKVHGFYVNYEEALRNIMIVQGKSSKTGFAKTIQKVLFRATEAPSNMVASKTIMGALMGLGIYFGVTNKVIKAPKGEKGKTVAEEGIRDAGAYMLMPTTGAALYGLASLKYFGLSKDAIKNFKDGVKTHNEAFTAAGKSKEGQKAAVDAFKKLRKETFSQGSLFDKILRAPAKVLGFGLESKPGSKLANFPKGFAGGLLRFAAFMFVLSPLIIKPVMTASRTIFGKTTEVKEEEAKAKAEKAARKEGKKNPKADFNMTQEELIQKLSERPELMTRLQNDPKLIEEIQKDPAKLIQLLNETPATATTPTAPSTQIPPGSMSPALREKLGQTGSPQAPAPNVQTPAPAAQTPAQQPASVPQSPMPESQIMQNNNAIPQTPAPQVQTPQPQTPQEQQRSYVPSSKPVATNDTTATPEQQGKLKDVFDRADKAEAEAMKYL